MDWAPRNGPPRTTEAQASPQDAPPMVLVEYGRYKPCLHFVRRDGSDVVVRANEANGCTPFQVGGQRVYYYRTYVEGRRVHSLRAPDAPDRCHPPLVSPDGNRPAWLCDAGSPDWQALVDGTAEIHFRLIVTDGRGRTPREVGKDDLVLVYPLRKDGTGAYSTMVTLPATGRGRPHRPDGCSSICDRIFCFSQRSHLL